jgi:molybdopterin converting factor subunit 1
MRVTVLYFAAARELSGCSEECADAPAGCTAGELLALLCARHAGLAALVPSLQLALNQRYAPRDAPLADGDELALIPPISGG